MVSLVTTACVFFLIAGHLVVAENRTFRPVTDLLASVGATPWLLATSGDMQLTMSQLTPLIRSALPPDGGGGAAGATWSPPVPSTPTTVARSTTNGSMLLQAACGAFSSRGNMTWLVWQSPTAGVVHVEGAALEVVHVEGAALEVVPPSQTASFTSGVYVFASDQQFAVLSTSATTVVYFAFDVAVDPQGLVAIGVADGVDDRCTSSTAVTVSITLQTSDIVADGTTTLPTVPTRCPWRATRCNTSTGLLVFDAAAEFLLLENVTSRWSYLSSPRWDFDNLTRLTHLFAEDSAEGWRDSLASGPWPQVARFPPLSGVVRDSTTSTPLHLHPGCGPAFAMAWLRWSAPTSGPVSVSANVSRRRVETDRKWLTVLVMHNRAVMDTFVLGSFPHEQQHRSELLLRVVVNDTVDVVIDVGPDGKCDSDNTFVALMITVLPTATTVTDEPMGTNVSTDDTDGIFALPLTALSWQPPKASRNTTVRVGYGWRNMPDVSLMEDDSWMAPLAVPSSTRYDLGKEFSLAQNPSHTWSYGWMPARNFTSFSLLGLATLAGDTGVGWWKGGPQLQYGYASGFVYRMLHTERYLGYAVPGSIVMVPGCNTTSCDRTVARWTSPGRGVATVNISTIPAINGGDSLVYVVVDGRREMFSSPSPAVFSAAVDVISATTIDLIVDSGRNSDCREDHVMVSFVVELNTTSPPVECPHHAWSCGVVDGAHHNDSDDGERSAAMARRDDNASSMRVLLVYDATSQFGVASNPNGQWFYGWSPPADFTPTSGPFHLLPRDPNQYWDAFYEPNRGFAFKNLYDTNGLLHKGEIGLHPGCDEFHFTRADTGVAKLRWVSPLKGAVFVNASFGSGDGGRPLATISVSGELTMRYQRITPGSGYDTTSFIAQVEKGTAIDAAVSVARQRCDQMVVPLSVNIVLVVDDASSNASALAINDPGSVARNNRSWRSATMLSTSTLDALRLATMTATHTNSNSTLLFDAALDFTLASNPSGVWSFGYQPNFQFGAPLTLLPQRNVWNEAVVSWHANLTEHQLPHVSLNVHLADYYTVKPFQLGVNPSCGDRRFMAVLRWTAPSLGWADVDVRVLVGLARVMTVVITRNGDETLSTATDEGPTANFSAGGFVVTNDTIDVAVLSPSDCRDMFTPVSFRVEFTPLPSPSNSNTTEGGILIASALAAGRWRCPYAALACKPASAPGADDAASRRVTFGSGIGLSTFPAIARCPSLPIARYDASLRFSARRSESDATSPWTYSWTPTTNFTDMTQLMQRPLRQFLVDFSYIEWTNKPDTDLNLGVNLGSTPFYGCPPLAVGFTPVVGRFVWLTWSAPGPGLAIVNATWLPADGGMSAITFDSGREVLHFDSSTDRTIRVADERFVQRGTTIDFVVGITSGRTGWTHLLLTIDLDTRPAMTPPLSCPFDAFQCPDGVALFSADADFSFVRNPSGLWTYGAGQGKAAPPPPINASSSVSAAWGQFAVLNVTFRNADWLGWTLPYSRDVWDRPVASLFRTAGPRADLTTAGGSALVLHIGCASLERPVVRWTASADGIVAAAVMFFAGDMRIVTGHVTLRLFNQSMSVTALAEMEPWSSRFVARRGDTLELSIYVPTNCQYAGTPTTGTLRQFAVSPRSGVNISSRSRADIGVSWRYDAAEDFRLSTAVPLGGADDGLLMRRAGWAYGFGAAPLAGGSAGDAEWVELDRLVSAGVDDVAWTAAPTSTTAASTAIISRFFGVHRRLSDAAAPGHVVLGACAVDDASSSRPRLRFTFPASGLVAVAGHVEVKSTGTTMNVANALTPGVLIIRSVSGVWQTPEALSIPASRNVSVPSARLSISPVPPTVVAVDRADFKFHWRVAEGDVAEWVSQKWVPPAPPPTSQGNQTTDSPSNNCSNVTVMATITYINATRSTSQSGSRRTVTRTASSAVEIDDASRIPPPVPLLDPSLRASSDEPTITASTAVNTTVPAATNVASSTASSSQLPGTPTAPSASPTTGPNVSNGSSTTPFRTTPPTAWVDDPLVANAAATSGALSSEAVATYQSAGVASAITVAMAGPGDAMQLARSTAALQIMYQCQMGGNGDGGGGGGAPSFASVSLAMRPLSFPDTAIPWLRIEGLSRGIRSDTTGGVPAGATSTPSWISIDSQLGAVVANVVAFAGGVGLLLCVATAAVAGGVLTRPAWASDMTASDTALSPPMAAIALIRLPSLMALAASLLAKGTSLAAARLWTAVSLGESIDAVGPVAVVAVTGTAAALGMLAALWLRLRHVSQAVADGHVIFAPIGGVTSKSQQSSRGIDQSGPVMPVPPALALCCVGSHSWFPRTNGSSDEERNGVYRLHVDGKIFIRYRGGCAVNRKSSGCQQQHAGDWATPANAMPWTAFTPLFELATTVLMGVCEGVAWRFCRPASIGAAVVAAVSLLWLLALRPYTVGVRNVLAILGAGCTLSVALLCVVSWGTTTAPDTTLFAAAMYPMYGASAISMIGLSLSVMRFVWFRIGKRRIVPIVSGEELVAPLLTPGPVQPLLQAPALCDGCEDLAASPAPLLLAARTNPLRRS